jgi:hypothetical protein
MSRYSRTRTILNSAEYYSFLRKNRYSKKATEQYATPTLTHPDAIDRSVIISDTYIWKYGDRLYKLANTYYNDPEYWWIIAWYNGFPTEAAIPNGALLTIPVNLEDILNALEF